MESDTSLPFSQEQASGPYPEPDELTCHPHTLLLKIHFRTILPSMPRFPTWSLPFRFSELKLFPLPHASHMFMGALLHPSGWNWITLFYDVYRHCCPFCQAHPMTSSSGGQFIVLLLVIQHVTSALMQFRLVVCVLSTILIDTYKLYAN
jgi:hypothetical protein